MRLYQHEWEAAVWGIGDTPTDAYIDAIRNVEANIQLGSEDNLGAHAPHLEHWPTDIAEWAVALAGGEAVAVESFWAALAKVLNPFANNYPKSWQSIDTSRAPVR
jgi:hypothetical protein